MLHIPFLCSCVAFLWKILYQQHNDIILRSHWSFLTISQSCLRTLAQKADLARDKQDRRGKSEEVSSLKTKTSVKSRLDDGYKSDDTHSSNHKTSIRERVGSSRDRSEDLSRSRSFSRDRSPKHRSSDDSRERSQKHRDIRARVGTSRDRDDNRDHIIRERVGGMSGKTSVRERLGDNRDNRDHSDHRDHQSNKKIFSRLGNRD